MGKRFYLGIGILVVFLVLGIGIHMAMDRLHTPAEKALEQACDLALRGDMVQAEALAHQAKQDWEKFWHFSASVADHTPMDEIDQMFAEMEVYAQAGEVPHFAACCAQLGRLISSMADAHRPNWWNFL